VTIDLCFQSSVFRLSPWDSMLAASLASTGLRCPMMVQIRHLCRTTNCSRKSLLTLLRAAIRLAWIAPL
jgi:hypothetical protein